MITLYQFRISHFCEKARWALDHKGISYRVKNLVPGVHRRTTQRLGAESSVPLLHDGATVVQGSSAIIDWADKHEPLHQLTPVNTTDAAMALEWERSADRHIGVPLRVVFYQSVLEDRALAVRLLTEGCAWWGRPFLNAVWPSVRRAMRRGMRIDADSAARARVTLERTFTEFEARLAQYRYLAGPVFSRADLTTCAMLAPLCRDIPDLPAELVEFIAGHHSRPLLVWAQETYNACRGEPSAP